MRILLIAVVVIMNTEMAKSQITGQVRDFKTGTFIKGAEVFIAGSQVKSITDQNGFFNLEGLPNGSYTVGCQKNGYQTAFQWAASKANQATILFILEKDGGKLIKEESLTTQILGKLMDKGALLPEWIQGCNVTNSNFKRDQDIRGKEKIYGKVNLQNDILGYSVTIHLQSYSNGRVEYQLQFYPLSDGQKQQQWDDSRFAAYQFSVQNFLEAALQGTMFQNGYAVFDSSEKPIQPESLLHAGYSGQSNYLNFNERMKIVHAINGATYTSWLTATGKINFSDLGLILNSDSVKVEGVMASRNVATQLPIEFSPPASKKIFSLSQYFEKTYVHTDKQYYYPGDTLWFKAYMNYATLGLIESLSKVLYVELLDSLNGGRIIQQKMLRIDDGEAWGEFILPDSLPSDFIALRVYTNWQRNFGEDQVYTKFFPFLKNNANLRNERTELDNSDQVQFKFNKSSYSKREKIDFSVSIVNEKNEPVSGWMSVSITDGSVVKLLNDSVNIKSTFVVNPIAEATKINCPLERGLNISGQYVDERKKPSKVRLTLMSSSFAKGFEFSTDVYGKFFISGLEFYDSITVSYSAKEGENDLQGGKLELDKWKPLPINIKWPKPDLVIEPEYKIDKNVTMLKDIVIYGKGRDEGVGNESDRKFIRPFGQPDYILSGDALKKSSWNVYEMMRGIPGLSLTFSGTNYQVRFSRSGSNLPPLTVIDNVSSMVSPLGNDPLLFINPADVAAIEVIVSLKTATGSFGGNGVILVYTKASGLRGRFDEYETVYNIRLKGFSRPLVFKGINHEDNFLPANSDFRRTLYWNPSIVSSVKNGPGLVSFYASDSVGPYLITIEGVTSLGKPFRTEKLIEIQE